MRTGMGMRMAMAMRMGMGMAMRMEMRMGMGIVRGHSGLPYTASMLLTSLPVSFQPADHFHGLLN
jgi:hypothetical protein